MSDGWERATTTGPRKSWDHPELPPEDSVTGEVLPGWELDFSRGHPGEAWERFDYHEERYWRRWVGATPKPEDDAEPYLATDGTRFSADRARRTSWSPTTHPLRWEPRT